MSIRATYSEAVNIDAANIWLNYSDNLISLILTALLLICFTAWLISLALRKSFEYSVTSLELALLLFIAAGLAGINIASNKRAAINDFVTLTVPIFAAIVLAQILNTQWKIKLTLVILIALACASAYQCSGQYFVDTQAMVEQYESDPQSMLTQLSIRPGSFEQWLFEHRLYTKGINGFLLTGNSVASFTIFAAFAALALFIESCKQLIRQKRPWLNILILTIIVIFTFANFFFVRSKGGTAALFISLLLFAVFLRFGDFLKMYRTHILIFLMALITLSVGLVISYGLKHNRLPGGNSMLVRWQYWRGAAEMYSDHRMTGVGPGNFGTYYTYYKNPAASEVVKDPHNFVLSILTQYGPLGILAFAAMLFAPLWSYLKYQHNKIQDEPEPPRKIPIIIAIITVLALLLARPVLKPIVPTDETAQYLLSTVFIMYLMPALVFALAFIVLWFASYPVKLTNVTICALLCGYLGVALHNLLDFAIFEPGVYTALWFTIACILALQSQNTEKPKLSLKLSIKPKIILALGALIPVASFCWFALLPVAQNTALMSQADRAYGMGFIDQTQLLLKHAARKDRLDPKPLLASGKIYLQFLERYGRSKKEILLFAEESLLAAIERNPADFKACEKLTDVYQQLARLSIGQQKSKWLEKAFDSAQDAVKLYPGHARLRFDLAQIAESLGKTDIALENYKKAVEIEDAFRKQFIIMYPSRKPVSRLEEESYNLAKQKIN